jgi:hypothetical protein
MVAFTDLNSPAQTDTSPQVLAPALNLSVTPPTNVPVLINVLLAILVELRLANDMTAMQMGTQAPDFSNERASNLFDIGPNGSI